MSTSHTIEQGIGRALARATLGVMAATLAIGLAAPAAALGGPWLSQADIRTQLVGQAMKGYYREKYDRNGERWIDDYAPDGGIKYSDEHVKWTGRWFFQEDVFCTFYNDGANGGCYLIRQVSRNCFEYVIVPDNHSGSDLPANWSSEWFARGWRGGEPSTCDEPIIG